MEGPEQKRRGRPPAFSPQRKGMHEIHLHLGIEIWTALREYAEEIGELSLSVAIRRIVRARLIDLGYVKPKHQLPSPKEE